MNSERIIENIKVILRKNKFTYSLSKMLYLPISIIRFVTFKIKLIKKSRQLAEKLKKLSKQSDRVFYFGVPIHENLGDSAQMLCIRKWIRHYFPNSDIVEVETWLSYDKKIIKLINELIVSENVIIIESGATFSYLHDDHSMHRNILKFYKGNRILFMPNTVNMPDVDEMKKTAALFNSNHKALFLARDPESFNMIQPYFDNSRILLFPDIVTTLIGTMDFEEARDGVLICKRIDGEKLYSDYDSKLIINQLKSITKVDLTDTNFENSIDYTYSHLEEVLTNKLSLFARYKVVLTDRYHGMIFSLIANTPVVVLATNGHKVREGAKWFMKDYPNSIWFCETPEEAGRQVLKLLNNNIIVNNPNLYNELYFNKLYDIFMTTTDR